MKMASRNCEFTIFASIGKLYKVVLFPASFNGFENERNTDHVMRRHFSNFFTHFKEKSDRYLSSDKDNTTFAFFRVKQKINVSRFFITGRGSSNNKIISRRY